MLPRPGLKPHTLGETMLFRLRLESHSVREELLPLPRHQPQILRVLPRPGFEYHIKI